MAQSLEAERGIHARNWTSRIVNYTVVEMYRKLVIDEYQTLLSLNQHLKKGFTKLPCSRSFRYEDAVSPPGVSILGLSLARPCQGSRDAKDRLFFASYHTNAIEYICFLRHLKW